MERRADPRSARRFRVHFWIRGLDKSHPAFTTNISTAGMFIATNYSVAPGTRVRAEVVSGESSFMVEGAVARVVKVSPTLRSVRQAGLGVRFLTVKELVEEMIPELAAEGAQTADDDTLPVGTFRLRFPSKEGFLAAYQRDISTGGLFVPTAKPAAFNENITIQIEIARSGLTPLRLEARVVHSLEPEQVIGGSNLMAGMGVELLNHDRDLARLKAWAVSLK